MDSHKRRISTVSKLSDDDKPKIVLPDKVDVKVIENVLKLNKLSLNELSKLESYTFNIFTLKEQTNNNELVTLVSYIWAKENIMETLPIDK